MSTKPMRVRWTSDEDIQCAILAGMGFSTKMIMAETGLTACQISYRLHKGRIYRKDYRDGTSDVAQRMMGAIPRNKAAVRGLLNLKVIK
tara:strand:+ start:1500 stop:1766 length:267 start_codon:yes stop_codon:yes gene_type:complete